MEGFVEISCPHCGEPSTLEVEAGERDQEFVQDCSVCCRPLQVRLHIAEDGSIQASVEAED